LPSRRRDFLRRRRHRRWPPRGDGNRSRRGARPFRRRHAQIRFRVSRPQPLFRRSVGFLAGEPPAWSEVLMLKARRAQFFVLDRERERALLLLSYASTAMSGAFALYFRARGMNGPAVAVVYIYLLPHLTCALLAYLRVSPARLLFFF